MSDDKPTATLRHGLAMTGLALLAAEPLIGAVTTRLHKHGWWLGDFDAVACGATTMAAGHSPYALEPACAGLRPAIFVYAPQVAAFLAPMARALGPDGMRLAFAIIFVPSLLLLLWHALFRAAPRVPLSMRLVSIMAIKGTPILTGNIGAVLHGLILASSLWLKRLRWGFVAAVVLAATVKPMLLTALLVLLYEQRPLRRRLIDFSIASALGLGAVLLILATAGPYAAEWHNALDIVVHRQPGRGFAALALVLRLQPDSLPVIFAYMVYAAAVVAAGFILVEGHAVSDSERVILGLGLAQLINPRLFEYNFDLYLLYPALAVIVMLSRDLNASAFRWLHRLFITVMISNFLLSILGIKWLRDVPGTFLAASAILGVVTVLTLRHHAPRPLSWRQGLDYLHRQLQADKAA